MVNEPAVNPAVAPILEGVNEHKPEGRRRRRDDRINAALLALVRVSDQPADQPREILRARADEIGNGRIRLAIPFADEAALGAPAHMREASVADDDALQMQEFIAAERPMSGFADGLPPPLDGSCQSRSPSMTYDAFEFSRSRNAAARAIRSGAVCRTTSRASGQITRSILRRAARSGGSAGRNAACPAGCSGPDSG